MRKLLLLLILLVVAAPLFAQQNANDVAHGSEKAAHKVAHPGEEHGEGHEAPKAYFGIPAWILKLANMLVFLGVLGWLIGGPIKNAFAARSEQIRRAADEARDRRAKADQLATDIQTRLAQIEDELRAIRERAEAEGERQKRELIAAAEAEAQKILTAARNEVDNKLKRARHDLTEYAGELASERAEALLRERINDADRHKLFSESVKELETVR
ncbi:MAG TPA: ATP synthase F0 subunit B [Thermoanaerobaculia bacterium]|nr:ATP synthase F0 subunit B [Thermoanaerobaculia bacterium]